jgi:ATP-dependent Clp protease ATP-binding subunit ClpA
MMFERFTDAARQVVLQAQVNARRLGHDYIGCEHLLLAAVGTGEPASVVLREQGVTPERVEAEILHVIGPGPGASADPLGGLDREALAAIGIDLDVVRSRIEAAFGPDALSRAVLAHKQAASRACRRARLPAWGEGPVARLVHHRRFRAAHRGVPAGLASHANAPLLRDPAPGRHLPFTPLAKKSLELSLREAVAMKDSYIGIQHLTLALLVMKDGTVPVILSALGVPAASLRAAILDRYRKAS